MAETTPTRPGTAWRIFAVPGALALIGYVAFYGCDRHLRTRHGPWQVTFRSEADGTPALHIAQPGLGIAPVTVRFREERIDSPSTHLPAAVLFDRPRQPVPFGTSPFDDLMYLPGTVVLHCFGHEVQMLPRGLFLNRREHSWETASEFDLTPADKLPSLAPGDPPSPRPPPPN